MTTVTTPQPQRPIDPQLEDSLASVEHRLAALAAALCERDAAAIDQHSHELHRALARAVDHFAQAARSGGVPPTMRNRLVTAGGQVAAQRESLARATAALDRAIEVLIPRDPPSLYSASGGADRSGRSGGVLQA